MCVRVTRLDVDHTGNFFKEPNGSPILEGMSADYQDLFIVQGIS